MVTRTLLTHCCKRTRSVGFGKMPGLPNFRRLRRQLVKELAEIRLFFIDLAVFVINYVKTFLYEGTLPVTKKLFSRQVYTKVVLGGVGEGRRWKGLCRLSVGGRETVSTGAVQDQKARFGKRCL